MCVNNDSHVSKEMQIRRISNEVADWVSPEAGGICHVAHTPVINSVEEVEIAHWKQTRWLSTGGKS